VERPLRRLRRGRDDRGTPRRGLGLAGRNGRAAPDQEVSALDTIADKARAASDRLAGSGGLKGKLAHELADDAVFIRKLKPSLIAKRARGEAPKDEQPETVRLAPSGGPSPFLVLGAAFAAGVLLAKWIDWRGHAHPRG